jgi:hypothetical protein
MRKNYIDNIRSFAILMLVPYHVFMMYNNWGEGQFVEAVPLVLPSLFIRLTAPWFMPLLFLLAGISACFARQKRSNSRDYIQERVYRLLLPFAVGMVTYVPFMSYIADVTNNGYDGGYFAHYAVFFTRFTDFGGAEGGFTPAHLWFLLYLFIISIVSLAVIIPLGKHELKLDLPVGVFILIGVIPVFAENFLSIGGKSLAKYFLIFLLGYFVFSREYIIEKLVRYRFFLLILTIVTGILSVNFNNLFIDFWGWIVILTVLGLSAKYLSGTGEIRAFFRKNSFLIYEFYYPVMVAAAYLMKAYFIKDIGWIAAMPILIAITFAVTLPLAYIITKTPAVRVLFGVK